MTTPLPPRQIDEGWEERLNLALTQYAGWEARLNASLARYVGQQNNPRVQRWVERRVLMFMGESSRLAADSRRPTQEETS